MKKLLIITALALGFVSCSTDDSPAIPQSQPTQLEIDVKECVKMQIEYENNNKGVPPVGLTLCDCVQNAIDNNKPAK